MYYRIISDDDNFAAYLPVNHSIELLESINGKSLIDTWKPIHLKLMDKKDTRPVADIMTGYMPFCSRKIYDAIKDRCHGIVEFLPCTVGEDNLEYFVFNILAVADTVDYEASKFLRYPDSEKIMFFDKILFTKEVSLPMFKIPDLPFAHYFCTKELKELIENANPQGVIFNTDLF